MKATADLKISAAEQARQIEEFIRSVKDTVENDGLLIGLSGGLDSAVAAFMAVRAVGANQVHLLNLVERDSNPAHQRDAQFIADELDIDLMSEDITTLLKQMGAYRLLPISRLPTRRLRAGLVDVGRRLLGLSEADKILQARLHPKKNSFISRGNAYAMAKHRLRMIVLYQHAEINNWLVVGAANRTEWLTGTFSKWGCDHCADLMPLLHLYRTQIEQLAVYVGVPARIREKTADPDVLPGINDKEALLGSFSMTDQILMQIESGASQDEIAVDYNIERVDKIFELHHLSEPLRKIPYHLSMG
ncbi:MAG: NAD(+) synthase [Anaerolineales bacterium]|jgi:NAD+ synthase